MNANNTKSTVKPFMRRRTKDLIFYCCFIALPLLHFIIFYVCVNLNSILLAFKQYDSSGSAFRWVGLENFKILFNNFASLTVFKVAFKNSFIVFVTGTVISMTLGLFFSYYIYKKAPFKKVFKIILFLPSIIPAIAMCTMFKQFADSAIPGFMQTFGINIKGFLQNPDFTLGTIIFYNVWIGFGVNVLLYLGAMNNISDSVVEAAHLDGASFFKEFYYITLPLVFGTMSTFIIVALGNLFINQASIFSFYGPAAEERIFTIGYYLYKETINNSLSGSNYGFPVLSSFGIFLTVITLPAVYFINWILKRIDPSEVR